MCRCAQTVRAPLAFSSPERVTASLRKGRGVGEVVWTRAILGWDWSKQTGAEMIKTSTEYASSDQHAELPTFQQLMEIKASRKQQLTVDRIAARARYDAMSTEDQKVIDEKFREMFLQLKNQFGRSRPFTVKRPIKQTDDETISLNCSELRNID